MQSLVGLVGVGVWPEGVWDAFPPLSEETRKAAGNKCVDGGFGGAPGERLLKRVEG